MKNVFLVLAVLAGFSVPLQAQGTLPVQVVCVREQGPYKPICNHVKQAVNTSPQFRQAKSGSRYVLILFALKDILKDIEAGAVLMSVSFGAVISDPLSERFMYHIATIPTVFFPSQSQMTAQTIVNERLPVAVTLFSDAVDEINSYGPSGKEFSEATVEDILREMMIEMDPEETN